MSETLHGATMTLWRLIDVPFYIGSWSILDNYVEEYRNIGKGFYATFCVALESLWYESISASHDSNYLQTYHTIG